MRALKALALAALIAAALGTAACGGDAKSAALAKAEPTQVTPVEVAAVTAGELVPTYTASASLEAEREAVLRAEIPGEVVTVLVEEGDRVEAGQVLARIDGARAALELKQAQSLVARMKHDAERNERLIGRQVISRDAYERARYDHEVQQAAADLAALSLSKTEIRAPYAGVVTRRHVKQGQWLKPQDPVFELADFGSLRARVDVPERVSGLIRADQPVQFEVDALGGRRYAARIERVLPVVDRATGTVGAVVEVDNAGGELRPGLFVRLAIEYQRIAEATLVPKTAVVNGEEGAHVYLVADSKVQRRGVRLGVEHGTQVQVLEGLSPGDTVVTVGQQSLKDGDAVSVVDAAKLASAP